MAQRFTATHMTLSMIGFFGLVIGVNATMATLAARTFGGTVVDNSYVASQRFNGWLAQGRAQAGLGWRASTGTEAGHPAIELAAPNGALTGAAVTAIAEHPLGRAPSTTLDFEEIRPGTYRATETLAPGRWRLAIRVDQASKEAHFVRDVTL